MKTLNKIWTKKTIIENKLKVLIPPKNDLFCISSNVYLVNLPKTDWIIIDLGGQKYSKVLLEELPDFEHILLTHSHADHIGDLDLFKNKKIYLSEKERKSFYDNPKETIFTDFNWSEKYTNKFYRVGTQADKIAKNPKNYSFLSVETDLIRDLGAIAIEKLDDLEKLEKNKIGFMLYSGHSEEAVVYFIKFKEHEPPFVFAGDIFAKFLGPAGNPNAEKPFTLKELCKATKSKERILLGHDQDYFNNREITTNF